MIDIHRLSIEQLTHGFARGAVSVPAAVAHYLDRIGRFDGQLNAYVAIDRDGALRAAEESARRYLGGEARPLEGVPIAIKANIDVAGLPTNAGVAARREAIARDDAEVVKRLKRAGAIVLGNLNMHEAAMGATTDNEAFGRTHNPHRIGYTPGGSSGGSGAAVAAGLCVAALGTDTLGSIRIPAAYNGVYGLKPTNGLVPDDGLVPLSKRLDVIGPLARSIADLRAMTAATVALGSAGPIAKVARLEPVDDHPEVEDAVRRSYVLAAQLLGGLGVEVRQYDAPELDFARTRLGCFAEAVREAADYFGPEIARDATGFSESFHMSLGWSRGRPEAEMRQARVDLDATADRLNAVLADAEAILMPTTPQAAFAHGGAAPVSQADFTALASIAGLPALSLPCGWTSDGLPVGVQLVGRAGSEAALLDLAQRLDAVANGYAPPPAFA